MKIIEKLIFFLVYLEGVHGGRTGIVDPLPPSPSAYTASIISNGISARYYSDRIINRERLDLSNENTYTIIDYNHLREYLLSKDKCEWSQIPGPITPLLVFRSFKYIGTILHNDTLCYEWNGCHYSQIPPAPYNYYATVKENLPRDLDLPTVGLNIHFVNLTFARPPASLFETPRNCSEQKSIYSKIIIKESNVQDLC